MRQEDLVASLRPQNYDRAVVCSNCREVLPISGGPQQRECLCGTVYTVNNYFGITNPEHMAVEAMYRTETFKEAIALCR